MKQTEQPVLENWYNEALDYGSPLFKNYSGSTFIIYKGFKITSVDGCFKIEDTRKSDFYTDVTKFDLKFFNKHGFIKSCDLLSEKRNKLRTEKYTKVLEKLYADKQALIKSKDIKSLKYLNLMVNIEKYLDLLQTCKAKSAQHKRKYSLPSSNRFNQQ